jgi:hypothetical protein
MKRISVDNKNWLKDLVTQRPNLLYKLDRNKYLISTNEPGNDLGDNPPLMFMSFGQGEIVHNYCSDLEKPTYEKLYSIYLEFERQSKLGIGKEREYRDQIVRGGDNEFILEAGPAFWIPDGIIQADDIIAVEMKDSDILKKNFKYTWEKLEYLLPCSAKVVDGSAVAICRTVRKHANILECGVDTVEEFRGKGYGSSVVSHWTRAVWKAQQIPCYSTQWENEASLALAKKAKLQKYAIDIAVYKNETN